MHTEQYLYLNSESELHAGDKAAYEQFLLQQSQQMHASLSPPNENDAQQAADFSDYEQHCLKQGRHARALLGYAAALNLASSLAKNLTVLVTQYAARDGVGTLSDVLAETVAEHVVASAFAGSEGVLHQPVSREAFLEFRFMVDQACVELEEILTEEVAQ